MFYFGELASLLYEIRRKGKNKLLASRVELTKIAFVILAVSIIIVLFSERRFSFSHTMINRKDFFLYF